LNLNNSFMEINPALTYYIQFAFNKSTFRRASRVALLVGVILNLINHPEIFISFSFSELKAGQVILTFLVPYLVSTYSSVLSGSSLKPGNVSQIDALLKCNSCKTSNFSVNIGQTIDECPTCKKNTRWKLKKLFSLVPSGNDMLKSLALFARHNPQPLFRLNEEGIVVGANPASEEMFGQHNLSGLKLEAFLPELKDIDLRELIENEERSDILAEISNHHFVGIEFS